MTAAPFPVGRPAVRSPHTVAAPPGVHWFDNGAVGPRQREVAVLVARELTNAEIARALTLTEGTVANHVRGVLMRLGLDSRTQLAVWVAKDAVRRSAVGIE